MRFWLFTNRRTSGITLHAEGCRVTNQYRASKGWTGPLTWDEIALIPVESYGLCKLCSSHGTLLVSAPPMVRQLYGRRRHFSSTRRKRNLDKRPGSQPDHT